MAICTYWTSARSTPAAARSASKPAPARCSACGLWANRRLCRLCRRQMLDNELLHHLVDGSGTVEMIVTPAGLQADHRLIFFTVQPAQRTAYRVFGNVHHLEVSRGPLLRINSTKLRLTRIHR